MLRSNVHGDTGGICVVVDRARNTSVHGQRHPTVCALNDMDVDCASHRCLGDRAGARVATAACVRGWTRAFPGRVSAAATSVSVVMVALNCTTYCITLLLKPKSVAGYDVGLPYAWGPFGLPERIPVTCAVPTAWVPSTAAEATRHSSFSTDQFVLYAGTRVCEPWHHVVHPGSGPMPSTRVGHPRRPGDERDRALKPASRVSRWIHGDFVWLHGSARRDHELQ